MKIQLVSDLHLEFGDIDIPNVSGADVLILSGDILVVDDMRTPGCEKYNRYSNFFGRVCTQFKNVIYVYGNHEHYHGNISRATEILKSVLSDHTNLHILDDSSVDIDDVLFVGGTLWTNFNNDDPIAIWDAKRGMNDFRLVSITTDGVTAAFLPEDASIKHKHTLQEIDRVCAANPARAVVVVGHHAPSLQSIARRYRDNPLNAAYASDLENFILDRPQIKLWTHGHVHASFDYMVGTTRVVCNPRGYYRYEENSEFSLDKIIEV